MFDHAAPEGHHVHGQRLHLKVRAGEIHSIFGANGAEKSTLAALVRGCRGEREAAVTGVASLQWQALEGSQSRLISSRFRR